MAAREAKLISVCAAPSFLLSLSPRWVVYDSHASLLLRAHLGGQVEQLLQYKGIVAEVAPGQSAGSTREVLFWLKNRRWRVIEPHIEFRIGAHMSKRSVEQRVYDKADYLRKQHPVRRRPV